MSIPTNFEPGTASKVMEELQETILKYFKINENRVEIESEINNLKHEVSKVRFDSNFLYDKKQILQAMADLIYLHKEGKINREKLIERLNDLEANYEKLFEGKQKGQKRVKIHIKREWV